MLIEVIVGSTRGERFSERAAAWVVERLSARGDMDVELVDLRDHPLPFFDQRAPLHTKRDYPTPEIARFGQVVDRADGFVVVTPEYNHGYPAVLKNAIDHTFVEWNRKPIGFVGWGNVGGARAIEQLRLVAVEMEMAPLRHAVHILPDVLIPALRCPTVRHSVLDAVRWSRPKRPASRTVGVARPSIVPTTRPTVVRATSPPNLSLPPGGEVACPSAGVASPRTPTSTTERSPPARRTS